MKVGRRVLLAALGAAALAPVTVFAGTTKYVYDALGRVTGALQPNGISTIYSYDAAGNRTLKRTGGAVTAQGFDPDFYRIMYPDIYYAGVDPFTHYNSNGWQEGRDPSAYFSTNGYRNAYTDIRNAGINPLLHYHSNGWLEGRDPSSLFDTTLYRQNYPDIAAANINPYAHYVQNGIYERRNPFGTGSYSNPN